MSLTSEEIRHRFGYHPATPKTVEMHEQVRETFIAFADWLEKILPDGRAKSTAFTKLQESSMWSNYAIAETAPVVLPGQSPSE